MSAVIAFSVICSVRRVLKDKFLGWVCRCKSIILVGCNQTPITLVGHIDGEVTDLMKHHSLFTCHSVFLNDGMIEQLFVRLSYGVGETFNILFGFISKLLE